MNKKLWDAIQNGTQSLTQQNIRDGYHLCPNWDGLLIHKDEPEADTCTCNRHDLIRDLSNNLIIIGLSLEESLAFVLTNKHRPIKELIAHTTEWADTTCSSVEV